MSLYAEIVLSLPLDQTFSYIVPKLYLEKAKIGSRVIVPLNQRMLTGFIVKLRKKRLTKELHLKEISEVLDENPVFSPSFLSFTRKLSEYYYSSWGEILQASLPPSFVVKSGTEIFLSEGGRKALKSKDLSSKEKALLTILQKRAYSALFLKRKLKVKNFSFLLSRLEKKRLIYIRRDIKKAVQKKDITLPERQIQLEMDFSLDAKSLKTADYINAKSEKQAFSPFLLFGSPEKREAVYFYLIKKTLDRGRKVLFLVPEISLTKDLIEKFEKRLGEKVALLHSRLSERRREVEWRKIKEEDVDLVVGPRSALLSPLNNLGLVIVDEEEDESYYQKESPSYDARKGALLRAKQEASVLVYGSDIPSVEAFYRAKRRGYLLCVEPAVKKRKVEIIDHKQEKRMISRRLEKKLRERLEKREPILVFINRRGYASFLFCSRCNHIPRCIHCDIALTYHRREEELVCHYCNYSIPKIDVCSECGTRIIRKRGIGIEVVEEELKRTFPRSSVACFDTDVIKGKKEQERILSRFRKGKIDILVGTQFLAHQTDLPYVSLVAILHPETTLTLSDYRASQKSYQTLVQMMKFGQDNERAEIVIQTAFPSHFSIRHAAFDDYNSFFNREIKFRRIMNYPPFSCLVEVLFQGDNLRTLARRSREFFSTMKSEAEDIEILGPALPSVSKVRGRNRVQVILKAKKKRNLDDVLRESLKRMKWKKSVFVYD